jgi:peptide/nickel transport system substrate-binding protein
MCPVGSSQFSRRDVLRFGAYGSAAVVLGGGAVACVAPSGGADGSTLVFAEGTGPSSLDPLGAGITGPALRTWRQMYDTLVWFENGDFVPQLATSWRTLDPLTWEFKLRPNVTFHNGEAFDANAVKFTMDRIMDPEQIATQRSRFDPLERVEVVDPLTVRFHTKVPFPVLLLGLTQAFVVPPKYVAANGGKAPSKPVGTGPFKFASWSQGENIVFDANKSYWGGAPKADRLEMRVVSDDSTRLDSFMAGEVHINMNLPIAAIDTVEGNKNAQVVHEFSRAALLLEFDTTHGGPTANRLVRQALNYAVDKQQLISTILNNTQRPLDGQLESPASLGYDKSLKAFPHDPAKARALLAEAGYPNGFDTVINGPIGKYPADRDLVIAICSQLQAVGVRAKSKLTDFGSFIQSVGATKAGPMFLIGWYDFGDPALSTSWFTSSSTLGKYYADQAYDDLIAKASSTLDQAERQSLYEQASQHMHDEAMALFLTQPAMYYGIAKGVTGFAARDDEMVVLKTVAPKGGVS